jgi:hypothetical protein
MQVEQSIQSGGVSMNIRIFTCAALIAAIPASAEEVTRGIDLAYGHTIHSESENKAGVAMALRITSDRDNALQLTQLCEELGTAAGLRNENGDGLRLRGVFLMPYERLAVEGFYTVPNDHSYDRIAYVPGDGVARTALDRIAARVGIPPTLLDETNVRQISCDTGIPLWTIVWHDVRHIGDEGPETVVARAHHRFRAIHRSVVQHATRIQHGQETQQVAIR